MRRNEVATSAERVRSKSSYMRLDIKKVYTNEYIWNLIMFPGNISFWSVLGKFILLYKAKIVTLAKLFLAIGSSLRGVTFNLKLMTAECLQILFLITQQMRRKIQGRKIWAAKLP